MACPGCSCGMAQIEAARRIDKVEVRPIDPTKIMDDNNVMVIINGAKIINPKSIEVKIKEGQRGGIVKIEMFADISVAESIVTDTEIGGPDGSKA